MKPEITKIEESTETCHLKIKGDLTVKHASYLYELFQEIKLEGKNIKLEINEPIGIDLCFLQMLWSYSESITNQGKSCKIIADVSPNDELLIKKTGLAQLLQLQTT